MSLRFCEVCRLFINADRTWARRGDAPGAVRAAGIFAEGDENLRVKPLPGQFQKCGAVKKSEV